MKFIRGRLKSRCHGCPRLVKWDLYSSAWKMNFSTTGFNDVRTLTLVDLSLVQLSRLGGSLRGAALSAGAGACWSRVGDPLSLLLAHSQPVHSCTISISWPYPLLTSSSAALSLGSALCWCTFITSSSPALLDVEVVNQMNTVEVGL